MKKRDPSAVVIDEFVGYLVAMLFLPATPTYMIASFLFFRFFDILKPQPIRWMERRLSGGMGIMLDDIGAAVYSNMTLQIFHRLF